MNLENFIQQNKNEIANEWIEFATENIVLAEKMDRTQVKDHVIEILDWIINDMTSSQTNEEQKKKSRGNKDFIHDEIKAASKHGEQRLDFGFDFMQLSSEFRALRASVLRLWADKNREENWKADFQDMTRFNEAVDEAWIISLKRFQEKLNESKNLFLGVLGHDLRNPISTIKGAHSILKLSKNLSEEEKKTLQYSEMSVRRMMELINNLLELTELRLGSGMTVNKEELEFHKLFKEIVYEQKLAFPKIDFRTDLGESVVGNWDKIRLGQMMTNLITNSVKHGDQEKPIKLKLSSDEQNAYFSVHNYGPHISEDILDKIFDYKFSSSNGGTEEQNSYGLGLLIVKEIVDAHQGKIKVLSDPNDGTFFKITLPKNTLK